MKEKLIAQMQSPGPKKILALACVSLGMFMDKIRSGSLESGEQIFDKASVFKRLRSSYNDDPLAAKLREFHANCTLSYTNHMKGFSQ